MTESRVRIGSEGALSPDDVARRGFTTVRRGLDPVEVRRFQEAVAAELRLLRDRVDELAVTDAPPVPSHDRPIVDIATLTTALGEETARVLRTAQEAAADLRARTEEATSRALADAHEEATRVRSHAESVLAERTAEADEVATKLRAEADEEVSKLRAEVAAEVATKRSVAESESEAAVHAAVERGREMVGEAQAARERMLTDLARRRKAALIQIEQLRAGRDRLLDAYRAVRVSLDEITDELQTADEHARLAAEEAARRAASALADVSVDLEHELEQAAMLVAGPEPAPAPAPVPAPAPAPQILAESAPELPATVEPESTPTEVPVQAEPRRRGRRRLRSIGDNAPVAALPASAVGGALEDVPVVGESAGEVDELFAKIRADRAEPATPEVTSPGAEPSVPVEAQQGDQQPMDPPRANADEDWLQQRDHALEPLVTALNRKVKRLLQDEQNLVLDRLRTQRGRLTAEATLPAAADHPAPYIEAAHESLAAAAAVGVGLAAAIGEIEPGAKVDTGALDDLASALATELLDPLRARLERSLAEDGSDQATAADSVNAAYTELKRHRIERVVGDQLTAAVSLGLRRALPEGTLVRWVVEDLDGPCPDCDDNSLAGPTPLGEEFPTGQPAPPAHAGCRCLLGPVDGP